MERQGERMSHRWIMEILYSTRRSVDHLLLEKQEYSTEMNINQGRNIFIFRQEDAG